MNLAEKLEKMVPRYLPDQRYFVTEIVAKQAGPKTKISIFLDGDQGIDIDVCAQVSRQIGKELDDTDLLKHPYTLMVSSPGLDRPLKLPRQYHRNIGKDVKIKLKNAKQKKGKLLKVNQDFIVIEITTGSQGETKQERIPFIEIETTHVLVSF